MSHATGLDQRMAAVFFDPAIRGFPAHHWPLLETLGHQVAKSAVAALWIVLVVVAVAASRLPQLRAQSGLLWATVLAMALGPTVVVLMKELNGYRCPWDLAQFGGVADYGGGWFVSRVNAGHCFPGGHAAGGFSLVALFFAGYVAGSERLRRAGLAMTIAAGCSFSLVRMAQGAHFLSHNLWSAAIDWLAAALVFAPLVINARMEAVGVPAAPASSVTSKSGARGLVRIRRAAGYSLSGLRAVWQREAAFRQEVIAATLLVPVALTVTVTPLERCALIASLGLVLVVELLNSAVEAVVDLVSPDHHPLAGIAKDAGSAAVLVAIGLAASVWLVVLV